MAFHPKDLANRIAAAPRFVRGAAPVLMGVLMALGHEPAIGNWPILVGLVLAFLSLPLGKRSASWHGWFVGVGYFAVTLRWIIEPFLVDIVRHGWMAPFAIFLMAGGLALFWAFAGWLSRFVAGPRPVGILWFAVFLTAMELARGHIFTGFPWGLWAYTLVGSVWDVWLAWVGPYGFGALIAAVAGVTAYSLHRGWTLVWPGLVGVLLATIGVQYITPTASTAPDAAVVRVVQPNAPQHQKWDPDWMSVFYNRAIEQTAAGEAVDVVVWPETSVPSLLNYAGALVENMSVVARGAPVVAGIQREENGDYFNSLIVIDGPTEISQIYDKAHLVPFGEYIPFANVLRPLGLGVLVDQVAGFKTGARSGVLEIEGLGRARVLICYEGIFPEEIQTGEPRPDVLLIITNDAWFGTGTGPRQHLVQAQARAIEQGLPVVRSANTGISGIIDARGGIVASLPLNEAGFVDAQVPSALPPTLYSRVGDWPLLVLLIFAGVSALVARYRFGVDPNAAQE
ncbi:apolipoprotein N-acyltransferase [Octadecabacter sp.]|nr:apolipoprotein N-acyltransferase [Octadecabacter sp.]